MNAVKDWLKQSHLHPIGRHRIGEHETTTGLQQTGHLSQHPGPIAGMQDGILTPDQVGAGIGQGDLLKGCIVDCDLLLQPCINIQAAMPIVFH